MGTINIKGKPYHYNEVELTYENAAIIDPATAKQNLLDFKRAMDKAGVKFLLMHGTLLGAVREHGFIKHDIDIDTCVMNEERLIESIPEIEKSGLKLCRHEAGLLYSFIRNGVYIDVYIVNKLPRWSVLRPFFVQYLHHFIPKGFFIRTPKMDFMGERFSIPNHHMELIEFWYGKEWRTPKSGAPSNDEHKGGTYLRKHFRFLFRPVYKWIK